MGHPIIVWFVLKWCVPPPNGKSNRETVNEERRGSQSRKCSTVTNSTKLNLHFSVIFSGTNRVQQYQAPHSSTDLKPKGTKTGLLLSQLHSSLVVRPCSLALLQVVVQVMPWDHVRHHGRRPVISGRSSHHVSYAHVSYIYIYMEWVENDIHNMEE